MKRFALVLIATAGLAGPAAAQSLSILLPVLSFPDGVIVPSTKGCVVETTTAPVCPIQE